MQFLDFINVRKGNFRLIESFMSLYWGRAAGESTRVRRKTRSNNGGSTAGAFSFSTETKTLDYFDPDASKTIIRKKTGAKREIGSNATRRLSRFHETSNAYSIKFKVPKTQSLMNESYTISTSNFLQFIQHYFISPKTHSNTFTIIT